MVSGQLFMTNALWLEACGSRLMAYGLIAGGLSLTVYALRLYSAWLCGSIWCMAYSRWLTAPGQTKISLTGYATA